MNAPGWPNAIVRGSRATDRRPGGMECRGADASGC
jgi:hypothetical protein